MNGNDIANSQTSIAEDAFEEMYIAVRDKEGRLYSDKQVAVLPDIDSRHVHYREWKMRQHSSLRLIKHLEEMRRPLSILEIGCGNGWLSAKLAQIPNTKVTGIDANRIEIEQAQRVFKQPDLKFIYTPFNTDTFDNTVKFDVVIFAASLQYFPSLQDILSNVFALLRPNGEVHVLDTHFYDDDEVETSVERSKSYYTSLGFAHMARYYFHHSLNQIQAFNHQVLFDPNNIWNRLNKKDAFYWITLKP